MGTKVRQSKRIVNAFLRKENQNPALKLDYTEALELD